MLAKIISGGQTGADRGALDACLAAGFPCGGYCPAGRRAEDGVIDPVYPLQELAGSDYAARTRKNVEAADATAIFHAATLRGGTALTARYCRDLGKPCERVDVTECDADTAARRLEAFIARHAVSTLNVAGPRESGSPGIHDFVRAATMRLLARSRSGPN